MKGQPIGNRVIGYDLQTLKTVLAWGVNGGLLSRNPLAGVKPPAEKSPRRPVLSGDQYGALLAVAEQIAPQFRTALVLAHETGHRLSAVRMLRWEDINLTTGEVLWRASNDKMGYEHVSLLTEAAIEILRIARRQGVISPYVLPSPTDPSRPVSRHLLRDWWERAEALAKLPHERGRCWHSLRRQFATELKHAPLKDLCALGGWKSPQTLLTCYQQADRATMERALATRQRLA